MRKPQKLLILIFLILLFLLTTGRLDEGRVTLPLLNPAPTFEKQTEVTLRTNQGLGPTFAVVDEARNRAYVLVPKRACFETFDQEEFAQRQSLIGVLDLDSNEIIQTIQLGLNLLGAALSPNGQWLYVANSFDDRVTIVDAETLEVTKTVPVGPNPVAIGENTCRSDYHYKPQHIAFSHDGKFAYATNSKGGAVSVFDTSTHALVKRIEVEPAERVAQNAFHGSTWGIATHPTRDLVYVAEKISGAINIINTTTNEVVGEIMLGPIVAPLGLAVSPDGEHLWVTDSATGMIVIVDTQTEAELTRVFINDASGEKPGWISFSQDGKWAYVAPEAGDTITIVDVKEFTVVDKIQAEGTPFAAVEHNGKLILTPRSADSVHIYE